MQEGLALLPIAALLGVSLSAAAQQEAPRLGWRAYGQFTGEHLDSASGLGFDVERLRFSTEVTRRRLTGGIQVDFGVDNLGERAPGSIANGILDIYLNYQLGDKHLLRAGEFKTPLGMDFNIGADLLDITKRGMEAGLVLQRDAGVMISARNLGAGFGYDVGVFNIAGRSSAAIYLDSQTGEDNAFAARGHFDSGPWHAEWAYGETTQAGGPGTADYRVADVALRYQRERLTFKLEWIEGNNVRGETERNEAVYYVHGAYRIRDNLELVARHYSGTSRLGGAASDLDNTYLGFSWWAYDNGRTQGRLQVNYVVAGGDGAAYTGVRGFLDDALLAQFQFHVSR